MLKAVLLVLRTRHVLWTRHKHLGRPARISILAVLLAGGVCAIAQAASLDLTDSQQDIIYSADGGGSIETRGATRITTLRGNVRVRQGQIAIYGDIASLEQDVSTGELIRVTVEGSPARFERAPDQQHQETIFGSSQTIIYYNQTDNSLNAQVSVVEFNGDASFSRGRTSLQCSSIKHIIDTSATDSPGPCSGILAPVE